jgi:hypothetical protein
MPTVPSSARRPLPRTAPTAASGRWIRRGNAIILLPDRPRSGALEAENEQFLGKILGAIRGRPAAPKTSTATTTPAEPPEIAQARTAVAQARAELDAANRAYQEAVVAQQRVVRSPYPTDEARAALQRAVDAASRRVVTADAAHRRAQAALDAAVARSNARGPYREWEWE